MGRMMKRAGVVAAAIVLAGGLMACSSKVDDVKNKVNKSNQQVQNEEQELFGFRKEDNGAVLTMYKGSDEEVEVPKEYDGLAVVRIDGEAFTDSKKIRKITIPDSVTEIDNRAFPEGEPLTIAAEEGTYAEYYAYTRRYTFETLGMRDAQASSVSIWNKEGVYCETFSPGQAVKEDWLKGVSFVQEGGKSVLRLDNCDIGTIEQHWTGDLIIELADGSKNYVTGDRGMDGINVHGNLTITGNGDISISGSDFRTGREGGAYVGYGVCVVGNMTIKDGVQMFAQGGRSKSQVGEGVSVNGVLTVSGSRLEAQAGESGVASPAIRTDAMFGDIDPRGGGRIVLDKVKVAEGGFVTPVHFVGYFEGSDSPYDIQSGESFSTVESVIYSEDMGFEGASAYVRIEPDTQTFKLDRFTD